MDMSAIAATLQGAGGQVAFQFSSNLNPVVNFDLSGLSSSGQPSWFTQWLKPQMTLIVGGVPVQTWAPYGSPNPPDYFFIVAVAVIGVLLVMTVLD